MENLVKKYLNYNTGDSKHYHKELEVRFGTRGKFIKKDQYDNVLKKLQSVGFHLVNNEGLHLLRIMNQFDPNTKQISNIRTEIRNLENIQYYCKHNRVPEKKDSVIFQKKFNMKENNKPVVPYDNNDFNFRVSFQIEDNVYYNSTLVSTLLERWEQIPKSYRFMNRIELRHNELPFICHLSIVKSSKKLKNGSYVYEKNIRNVNLFNQRETYEIEIEIDYEKLTQFTRKVDFDLLISNMRKMIKYVLCGLQNSNYPVSYGELDNAKNNYLELVNNKKDLYRVEPRDFLGPSTVTLQRIHIRKINESKEETNISNIRDKYTVTEKADGERRLLFINDKGNVYMIDTNMDIQFTGIKISKKNIFNSLIDGELILHDKFGNFINLFACFDVYFINKEDRRGLNLVGIEEVGRLDLLERFVHIFQKDMTKQNLKVKFDIIMKEFRYGGGENGIFNECKKLLQNIDDGLFNYEIDGLIFTPMYKSIPIKSNKFTWTETMKWKPPEFNTIDFLVSFEMNKQNMIDTKTYIDESNNIQKYKTLYLRVGYDEKRHGYMNPVRMVLDEKYESNSIAIGNNQSDYKPYLFYPSNPYDEDAHICNLKVEYIRSKEDIYTEKGEIIENNTIVEFAYDTSKSTSWAWKPLRVRYDKTRELRNNKRNFGNDYSVANNNWNSIHNPVTKEMISSGLDVPDIEGNDDVYYNRIKSSTFTKGMRDFHNLFVKKYLISSVSHPGDKLIDLAVGKGGDFPKWIDSELSLVVGIDSSKDNIENRVDGAYARYLNYKKSHKNIPDALFIHGDSSEVYNLKGIKTTQYLNMYNAILGSGAKDEKLLGKNVFHKYGIAKDGFEVCSCQFALHYFFASVYSLENFIQNVINNTQVGGYFIGTSYDGKTLFSYLESLNTGESKILYDSKNTSTQGNKIWEIKKQYSYTNYEDNVSCLGYDIDVYQDSINKTFKEYLVNYDYFTKVMEQYGFRLLNGDELKSLNMKQSKGSFKDLYSTMKQDAQANKKTYFGNALEMSSQEKEISFLNTYFIYKKTRHEISPVKLSDAPRIEENEIAIDSMMTDLEKQQQEQQEKQEQQKQQKQQKQQNK